ncbi:hypothetical protein MKW98_015003 [Papaver atlanticum]|uniref:Uncharacterized protein n=1 Tax=Papaver atlanticum TaxID=357466 RepID=A0AAD4XAB4_9MAGN|nr:hypothetical protein MKW98_015003 [Papaver atlanticum]
MPYLQICLVEALFLSTMGDSSPSEDSDSEYVNSLHDLDQLHEDDNTKTTYTREVISDTDTSSDDISEVCALNRPATFPCSKVEMPDDGPLEANENPTYNRSTSLPVPLKSALRGGREKYGMPQKKLTVTWAHDVYDPPVTLVSHSAKGGHNHHRSYRSSRKSSRSSNSSKHKHKGGKSSSRSSSSSNAHKKHHHHRKHSGSHSESRARPVECRDRDRLAPLLNAMNRRSTAELSDFSLGALARALPDNTKCGTSYFMKSLTELHLPVAEAT